MTEDRQDDKTLYFRDGIPGFPEAREFMLVDIVEDGAFQILQSAQDPDLSMIVCVPWLFFPDYAPEISTIDQLGLGIDSPEDAVVFVPVTIDAESESVHLNLVGPFIVNARTREGRQVVLAESDYPLRATVHLGAD